jgi:uncharacterized protein (DUF302 family)
MSNSLKAYHRRTILVLIFAICVLLQAGTTTMAAQGLITVRSSFTVSETLERLDRAISDMNMKVMSRIDHGAAAATVDMHLRPTHLIIFGSPKGGTPVMQLIQTLGIDLPLKALVWQDEDGTTWLSYNDPMWLVARHDGGSNAQAAVHTMTAALAAVAGLATSEAR